MKFARSHTGINDNTSMASQVKVREAAWQVTAGMGKLSQAFPNHQEPQSDWPVCLFTKPDTW